MKKQLLSITLLLLSVINNNSFAQTIPEAAREKYVMAITLRDQAKNASDYDSPITKFKEAIALAPSWAEAYKELGLTLELAGKFDEAISNLTKYISFNPPADDARKAQDEIYIIKAKKEKADLEHLANTLVRLETQKKEATQKFIASLEGVKYISKEIRSDNYGYQTEIEIKNGNINGGQIVTWINPKRGVNAPRFFIGLKLPWFDGQPMPLQGRESIKETQYEKMTVEIINDRLINDRLVCYYLYFVGEKATVIDTVCYRVN